MKRVIIALVALLLAGCVTAPAEKPLYSIVCFHSRARVQVKVAELFKAKRGGFGFYIRYMPESHTYVNVLAAKIDKQVEITKVFARDVLVKYRGARRYVKFEHLIATGDLDDSEAVIIDIRIRPKDTPMAVSCAWVIFKGSHIYFWDLQRDTILDAGDFSKRPGLYRLDSRLKWEMVDPKDMGLAIRSEQ